MEYIWILLTTTRRARLRRGRPSTTQVGANSGELPGQGERRNRVGENPQPFDRLWARLHLGGNLRIKPHPGPEEEVPVIQPAHIHRPHPPECLRHRGLSQPEGMGQGINGEVKLPCPDVSRSYREHAQRGWSVDQAVDGLVERPIPPGGPDGIQAGMCRLLSQAHRIAGAAGDLHFQRPPQPPQFPAHLLQFLPDIAGACEGIINYQAFHTGDYSTGRHKGKLAPRGCGKNTANWQSLPPVV